MTDDVIGSHLNTVMAQSWSRDLGEESGQVLINVFQHQSEVQAPAHCYSRGIQQSGWLNIYIKQNLNKN